MYLAINITMYILIYLSIFLSICQFINIYYILYYISINLYVLESYQSGDISIYPFRIYLPLPFPTIYRIISITILRCMYAIYQQSITPS